MEARNGKHLFSSMAYSGTLPLSFGFNVSKTSSPSFWILDYGAPNHMTPLSNYFSTYSPCPNNKKSQCRWHTCNSSWHMKYKINSFITVKKVLHVPKLSTNLASIQKLTKTYLVSTRIWGRMIGCAREGNDLYYLEEPCLSIIEKAHMSQSPLEHPSFETIKVMFPSLLFKLNVESFQFDVCETAKHKHIQFPLSNKRSTFSFYLIHTDLWGSSSIPDVSRAQ
ncbi:hypothetical protein CR513_49201, partial [Mucuna pruriens]